MTAWNGLMISALSRAGAAFGEKVYVDAATSAAMGNGSEGAAAGSWRQ